MIANSRNVFLLQIFLYTLLALMPPEAMTAPSVLSSKSRQLDAEEAAGQTEGDMLLTPEQQKWLTTGIQTRNGLITQTRRWPNGVVYYKIVGTDFEPIHINAIKEGIQMIESTTCIKFVEADALQPHYVAISSKKGGCYTAVGYQRKVQEMNLEPFLIGEGCFRSGTVLHEFMHALGFYHEQSSAIRDDYIDVIYSNIVPGKEFNFEKYSPSVVTDFDVGYDYESCLHYRRGAFSINGEDTIVPKDAAADIGQRASMSAKDIEKINIMYKCPVEI